MTVTNTVYSLHSCLSRPQNICRWGGKRKQRRDSMSACLLLTLRPHTDYTFSGLPSVTKKRDLSCWHLKRERLLFGGGCSEWNHLQKPHSTLNTHLWKTQHKLCSRSSSQLCRIRDYNFEHTQITHAPESHRHRCWEVCSLPVIRWKMGFTMPLYPLPICPAMEAITVMYG